MANPHPGGQAGPQADGSGLSAIRFKIPESSWPVLRAVPPVSRDSVEELLGHPPLQAALRIDRDRRNELYDSFLAGGVNNQTNPPNQSDQPDQAKEQQQQQPAEPVAAASRSLAALDRLTPKDILESLQTANSALARAYGTTQGVQWRSAAQIAELQQAGAVVNAPPRGSLDPHALGWGDPCLDEAFEYKGLIPGVVTEIVGPSASGKTQLCMAMTAAALAQGRRVVWVETSGSFSITRLQAYLRAHFRRAAADALLKQAMGGSAMRDDEDDGGADAGHGSAENEGEQNEEGSRSATEEAEDKLQTQVVHALGHLRVVDVAEAVQLVTELGHLIEAVDRRDSWYDRLRLVVVDSVAAALGPVIGSGPRGHMVLERCKNLLQRLASCSSLGLPASHKLQRNKWPAQRDDPRAAERALCVVCTNTMVAFRPESDLGDYIPGPSAGQPALGETWRYTAAVQISLLPLPVQDFVPANLESGIEMEDFPLLGASQADPDPPQLGGVGAGAKRRRNKARRREEDAQAFAEWFAQHPYVQSVHETMLGHYSRNTRELLLATLLGQEDIRIPEPKSLRRMRRLGETQNWQYAQLTFRQLQRQLWNQNEIMRLSRLVICTKCTAAVGGASMEGRGCLVQIRNASQSKQALKQKPGSGGGPPLAFFSLPPSFVPASLVASEASNLGFD